MKHRLTVMLLLILPVTIVPAQQTDNVPVSDDPPSAEVRPAPSREQTTVEPAQDSFTPSETISEDLSVPFPVDI